jgi:uncharacterized RDD family membrane protein YckC
MVQREKPLDATIGIVTPENISFRYRVAGPFRRLPAFIIDLLLRSVALLIISIPLFWIFDFPIGLAATLLAFFLSAWFYGGLLETYWNGQTVGKRLMGIRVLSTDGQPINGLQAMMRNVLRFTDMMPFLPSGVLLGIIFPIPTFVIGLVAPMLNKRFQRLGDLVCGTMVVIEERDFFVDTAKLEDPRVAQLAAELPASFPVSHSMAQALATYVDRRQLFSPPRRREIARHVGEPLVRRFGLPADTSYDLLLCSLYHRTFLAHQDEDVVLPPSYLAAQSKPLAQHASILTVLPEREPASTPPPANSGAASHESV